MYQYSFLLLILFSLLGCQERQTFDPCKKYANENYSHESIDSSMTDETLIFHKNLLKSFDEPSVKDFQYESYQVISYSTHGYGRLINFFQLHGGFILKVRCLLNKNWFTDCEDYILHIEQKEWDLLVKMIYEFDFWTEEEFRGNDEVLDGHIFFLEGNRPHAARCDKKTYKLIGRGSTQYDKIKSLCENILEYKEQLQFENEQRKKYDE